MNYAGTFATIRDQVSAEERQMRVDLAACYRLVAHYDMDDLFATHISARVPGPTSTSCSIPTGCSTPRSRRRTW